MSTSSSSLFAHQVGQTIPDLELFTPQGEIIRLQELLDREYVLLIFLRHLT
jgi:peroxiredoxin